MNTQRNVGDERNDMFLNTKVFQGDKCYFSLTLDEHLPILSSWWNIPEISLYQQGQIRQRSIDDLNTLFSKWSRNNTSAGFGYSIFNPDHELIGHFAVYDIYQPINIGVICITIGPQFQNQGYGSDALKIGLKLAFYEYNVNKLEARVYSFNPRSIRVFSNQGFIIEGSRRNAAFHDGKFFNEIFMGITFEEFKQKF